MTITASLFKETKGPALQRVPACEKRTHAFARFTAGTRLRETQAALFQIELQISEPKVRIAFRRGWASLRNGPADEQGRFPGSSLLSSALASKDQGGSPDHASRLFALGSIRTRDHTLLWPSDRRDRGHPWRE